MLLLVGDHPFGQALFFHLFWRVDWIEVIEMFVDGDLAEDDGVVVLAWLEAGPRSLVVLDNVFYRRRHCSYFFVVVGFNCPLRVKSELTRRSCCLILNGRLLIAPCVYVNLLTHHSKQVLQFCAVRSQKLPCGFWAFRYHRLIFFLHHSRFVNLARYVWGAKATLRKLILAIKSWRILYRGRVKIAELGAAVRASITAFSDTVHLHWFVLKASVWHLIFKIWI